MTNCPNCNRPYKEGQLCLQKKQDGHVLCVPERVVTKSSGPARVKRNLMVAKFTFPGDDWKVDRNGYTYAGEFCPKYFDLADEKDRDYALIALRHKGWEIKETTRDRKPYYKAVKHLHEPGKPKTESGLEHEDIEILIGRVVEKVLEGKS